MVIKAVQCQKNTVAVVDFQTIFEAFAHKTEAFVQKRDHFLKNLEYLLTKLEHLPTKLGKNTH